MASTYLTRTFQSGGNRKKWTMSMWVKRSKITAAGSADNMLFQSYVSTYTYCPFLSDDRLRFQDGGGGNKTTTMKFRDTNAWYHIVIAIDTDLSTADDRYKIYVNGNRITAFDTSTNPSQGYEGEWNKAQLMNIGRHSGSVSYFDGLMSHIHFCDGYQYQASDFGQTDSTTGEWKIKTSPSVSYGTTGFFILKDGNSVTDQSGNSNNWTANGTLTKTEDNPSNNFATINPLQSFSSGTLDIDFANTRVRGNGSAWMRANAGLAAKSGKWYYEAYIQHTTSGRPIRLGWDSADNPNNGSDTYYSGFNISTDGYIRGGVNGYNGYDPDAAALGTTFTTGDYIGLAIDIDGDTVTAYKNGTVISNVNALSLSGYTNCSIKKSRGHWITPSVVFYSVSNNDNRTEFNFGNGAFANTQLTGTTYTDSAGFGVFKYQPPTNYLAWCTKNLNQ